MFTNKKFLRIFAVLMVALLILPACGPGATPVTEIIEVEKEVEVEVEVTRIVEGEVVTEMIVVTATPEPAEEEVVEEGGGELIFALSADEIRLDPLATTWNTDILIHNNIYLQLYRVNEDGSGLEPFAAESYEVNDEATVWTFTLRDDIKFSDGTPITAEDVVYSIERGFSETSLWGWIYEEAGLESGKTTALDERTVQFELLATFVPFVSYISGYWASIFPKAALEEMGDEAFFQNPITSGDWTVEEFVQADHLTIVPSPYAIGEAKLDRITIPLIPDDNTRMLQLSAGQIDVGYIVPASQIDSINSLPDLVVNVYPFAFTEVLYDNQAKAPFDDENFRRALNYAIDREALIDAILFGHATMPGSFLPKGVIYWDDSIEGYPFDLEKAEEYLALSNYPDGYDFELWTTTTSATGIEIATALQGMWNQLPGVNVEIVQYENAVLREKRDNGEHWVFVGGYSSDVADPGQITAWFLTGYVNDAFRHGNVDEVKPMLATANAELDPVTREVMFHEIQQWSQDHSFCFNLYYTNSNWGMKKSVKDLWVNPLQIMDLNDVWIDE
ncbi:MAG: ABC transporter substrate-binding protein [Anaerolineaceae bacterium]|nr:ABC transporter substrate-binding protein [Anaerolineaceae bacterium]